MRTGEERLEALIDSKSFSDLSIAEREFVLSLLTGEEEYEALRSVEVSLKAPALRSAMVPQAGILAALKNRVRKEAQVESLWNRLIGIRIPAYAVLLLLGMTSWITFALMPAPAPLENRQGALLKTDTLFVTRTDTVFRERVIYKTVRNVAAASPPVKIKRGEEMENPPSSRIGVSMKDKEELNKLLVSGSD